MNVESNYTISFLVWQTALWHTKTTRNSNVDSVREIMGENVELILAEERDYLELCKYFSKSLFIFHCCRFES